MPLPSTQLIDQIDAVLPQTQCGLCGYGGCRPYAEAIANQNETINHCPPGGVNTLQKLAAIVKQDPAPFLAEMAAKTKPPVLVKIREQECIGCTKCIQACPVDAIIGAAKLMHTVISAQCTGCELCIEPCPVDCIEIVNVAPRNDTEQQQRANQARIHFQTRNQRLAQIKNAENQQHLQAKFTNTFNAESLATRKAAIAAALARVKARKSTEAK